MSDVYFDAAGNTHEGVNYSDSSGTYVCPERFNPAVLCGERLYDKPGGTDLRCHKHGVVYVEVEPDSLTEVVTPLIPEAMEPPKSGPNAPKSDTPSASELAEQIQELQKQLVVVAEQERAASPDYSTLVSDQAARMEQYKAEHPDEFDEDGEYVGSQSEEVVEEAVEETPDQTPDHAALVAEYEALAGSPPDGRWGDARIQAEIDDMNAANAEKEA